MNCLILSTPDLTVNPLVNALESNFEYINCPKFNQLEQHSNSVVELEIHKVHQKILQDHQKQWYQTLSITNKKQKQADYCAELNSIVEKFEQEAWLLHDPLLVHFLPLWLDVVDQPKIIFHYSNPMECALSLQQKWRFPIAFGLALWESYVLASAANLHQLEYALVSDSKLQTANKSYLKSVSKSLAPLKLTNLFELAQTDNAVTDLDLPEAQKAVFNLLEKGGLKKLAKMSLSNESQDIMNYYGQLRAGYEQIKTERDKLKFELASRPNNEELDAEEVEQVPQADEQLSIVRVYIEGMDMVEFYADPQSPVLDMLRENLLDSKQDQLIYLNYGEDVNDTIYFMSSSLLAMETEPVSRQH